MTPDQIKAHLVQLAALSEKSKREGEEIKTQAAERLQTVQKRMDELRSKAITDPAAEEEYLALTEESGRLKRILRV